MFIVLERRKLWEGMIPFDKEFRGKTCHATGYEVLIDGKWWNEYKSDDPDDPCMYYGLL